MTSPVNPRSPHSWHDRAACRTEGNPDWFHPDGTTGTAAAQISLAKRVCARCPVAETCLQWALDNDQKYGLWGGLTEQERQTLTKAAEMNQEAAA